MRFDKFSFASIQIDGSTYEHDVMVDRGKIRQRKKKPSKQLREQYGHTPWSVEDKIPWKCQRLVVGTGAYGRLPVMEQVKQEAKGRKIKLLVLPTNEAIQALQQDKRDSQRDLLAPPTTGLGAAARCAGNFYLHQIWTVEPGFLSGTQTMPATHSVEVSDESFQDGQSLT